MKRNAADITQLEPGQRYLIAEFNRLKQRLRDEPVETAVNVVEQARASLAVPAPIDVLAQLFSLSVFERDVLLLCAGLEMDAELARYCVEIQGSPQRPFVSFALSLAVLDKPHWSALPPIAALRRWRMIDVDDSVGLTAGRLRIDERILHYIAGINYLDVRLQPFVLPATFPAPLSGEQRRISQSVLENLDAQPSRAIAILLNGDDPDGQRDVAAELADRLQLQLLRVRAEDLPATCTEIDTLATLWEREVALTGSVLLVENRSVETIKAVTELTERLGTMVMISGPAAFPLHRRMLRFIVNKPGAAEQKRLWEEALGGAAARMNGSLDGVASQFRLSARTILAMGQDLRTQIASSDKPDALLWRACRVASRTRLDDFAQRLEPLATWDDLILPPAQVSILRQIGSQAKHRLTVYGSWGFDAKGQRGLGISALFAGESGTGKTLAAEVLANELHLDLYRIDLASVVSKYIGETEKNLGRVFDAAEDNGAILLFDEADALFGKRSEVRDSHDRYANIEVSYLLQRMERYRGLAILTTNAKSALDSAFERRLRFIVQFPFPDQQEREAIWRRIFPANAPTAGIDCAKLARLNVCGGNIRNIALNAAFLAADSGPSITMSHLLQAAHAEAAKRDRAVSDAEVRGWV